VRLFLALATIFLCTPLLAADWFDGVWKLDVESTKANYQEAGQLNDDEMGFLVFLSQGSLKFEDEVITAEIESMPTIRSTYRVLENGDDYCIIAEKSAAGLEFTRKIERVTESTIRIIDRLAPIPIVYIRKQ